jgi:hypothetical protein
MVFAENKFEVFFTRKLNCKAIFHYESGIDVDKRYFFQKVVKND